MKLRELKYIIAGIGEPIDRIAGFCDSYDHMLDCCSLECKKGILNREIIIDTCIDEDCVTNVFYPVPEIIGKLLALPDNYDDFSVIFTGFNNDTCCENVLQDVRTVKTLKSPDGKVGICLLGRSQLWLREGDAFLTKIIIEDPKAKELNVTFEEFLLSTSLDEYEEDVYEVYVRYCDDYTVVSYISDERNSSVLIALLAGTFDGVYFCRTPLNEDSEVERLSNDRKGKYWGSWQAAIYPAYVPQDERYHDPDLTMTVDSWCYEKECDTEQEMEQFIADRNPDFAVGDIVQRITTRYINDPLDFILSQPEHED